MRRSSREPSGNGAPLFQPRPEPLDHIAVVLSPVWAGDRRLVALGWDSWGRAPLPDVLPERMARVAPVGHDPQRHARQSVQQGDGRWELVGLPWREREGDCPARAVGDHAGLGSKAAT